MSIETAIEFEIDSVRDDIETRLMEGRRVAVAYRGDWGRIETAVRDAEDLISAMISIDDALFNRAVIESASDPIEGGRILNGLMERGARQIIGELPIRAIAEYNIEVGQQQARDEALIAAAEMRGEAA